MHFLVAADAPTEVPKDSGSAPRWVMMGSFLVFHLLRLAAIYGDYLVGVGVGFGSHLVVGSLEIFDAECIDSHH